MKKALLAIALLFASVQLRASHVGSELNLRMFDNSWFVVTIDRMAFNQPVTRFRMNDITPGNRFVTITRVNPAHGYHMGGPRNQVVYRGFINVPARSEIHALVDRAFRLRINKIEPLFANFDGGCSGNNNGHDGTYGDHDGFEYHEENWNNGCSSGNGFNYCNSPYAMSDESFAGLINTLTNMSFESSRMQVSRNAIASNYFTSRQVSELMRMMTFDSSRLEIAKLAFEKTIDHENYWVVNNQFTFESSIVELNNYIHRS